MAWPKLLVLVRHAESIANILSREALAKSDIAPHALPLTERGKRQAKITGEYLNKEFGKFDVYYVSYYKRAQETMRITCPEAKVYEDPRLAEAQRGIWHGMSSEEIKEKFPEEVKRKEREGLYHYRPPGGENWPDIELRIHSFLGTLNRDCEDQRVLIVVHGHWLTLFERLIHRFSIEEAVYRYQNATKENASVTVYDGIIVDGKSRLVLTAENIVPWKGKL